MKKFSIILLVCLILIGCEALKMIAGIILYVKQIILQRDTFLHREKMGL